jgi:hypothetical protein
MCVLMILLGVLYSVGANIIISNTVFQYNINNGMHVLYCMLFMIACVCGLYVGVSSMGLC